MPAFAPLPMRRLGSSDVELTGLGLGGAPLGNQFGEVSETDADALLNEAWELGIRYFDTAPFYGSGLSEHRVGRLLRERGDYVLSTKVGRVLRPSSEGRKRRFNFERTLAFDVVHDYSHDGILRSVEDSLQRLGLAAAQLLLVHDACRPDGSKEADFAAILESGFRALSRLRSEGTVKAIGVGNNFLSCCRRFAEAADFDFFMISTGAAYTLLVQDALNDFLPYCAEREIGVLIGGVYNGGILATGATPDAVFLNEPAPLEVRERAAAMERVCESHGITLQAAALQFPLGHQAVASVVQGSRSAAQVRQTVEAFRTQIPQSFWSDLKTEGLIRSDAPEPAPARV